MMTFRGRRVTLRASVSLAKPHTDVSNRRRVRPDAGASDDTSPPVRLPAEDPARLPTQDELPCSDGEPLESERHVQAMVLLINSLQPWLRRRHEGTGEGG